MSADQLQLPYAVIDDSNKANRATIREISKRSRETFFLDFSILKIREGFNSRTVYNKIDELADMIKVNGLTPLTVDVIDENTAIIEKGHRRYEALCLLHKKGTLKTLNLPGIKEGMIECFINNSSIDELTRLKNQISDNHSEPFTALETAEVCYRLKQYFGLTIKEIAGLVGFSRQQVENFIILSEQTDDIKQSIKSGKLSVTAAIELARKIKDKNAVSEKVQLMQKKSSTGRIKVADIKKEDPIDITPASENTESLQEIIEADRESENLSSAGGELHEAKDDYIKICKDSISLLDKVIIKSDRFPDKPVVNEIEAMCRSVQKNLDTIIDHIKKNMR